jgi:hypothetical protein
VLFSSQRAFNSSHPFRAIKKSASEFADRLPKYGISGLSQVKILLFSKNLLFNSFALFWLIPESFIQRIPNLYAAPFGVKAFLE